MTKEEIFKREMDQKAAKEWKLPEEPEDEYEDDFEDDDDEPTGGGQKREPQKPKPVAVARSTRSLSRKLDRKNAELRQQRRVAEAQKRRKNEALARESACKRREAECKKREAALEAEKASLEADKASLEQTVKEIRATATSAGADEALVKRLATCEQEKKNLETRYDENVKQLLAEKEIIRADYVTQGKEINELKARMQTEIDRARKQGEENQTRRYIEPMNETILMLKKQLKEYQRQGRSSTTSSEYDQIIRDLQANIDSLNAELRRIKSDRSQFDDQADRMTQELSRVQKKARSDKDDLTAQLESITLERDQLKQRYKAASRGFKKKEEEVEKLEKKNKKLGEKLKKYTPQLALSDGLKQDNEDLRSVNKDLQIRISELTREINRLNGDPTDSSESSSTESRRKRPIARPRQRRKPTTPVAEVEEESSSAGSDTSDDEESPGADEPGYLQRFGDWLSGNSAAQARDAQEGKQELESDDMSPPSMPGISVDLNDPPGLDVDDVGGFSQFWQSSDSEDEPFPGWPGATAGRAEDLGYTSLQDLADNLRSAEDLEEIILKRGNKDEAVALAEAMRIDSSGTRNAIIKRIKDFKRFGGGGAAPAPEESSKPKRNRKKPDSFDPGDFRKLAPNPVFYETTLRF